MNNVVALPPQQMGGVALIPKDFTEAMRLAEMMARCALVPRDLQGKPAECLMVIEQAGRWGMSPFAVAQEVSVIQCKLMHSGKIVSAAVQGSGVLAGRLHYEYAGEGEDRTVTVRGTLRGEAAPREVTVRLGDVATKNEQWRKQPDQQLAYHAARVWARRYVPEIMLGVWSPEEFDEQSQRPPAARGPTIDATAELGPPPAETGWAGPERAPAEPGSMREEAQRIVAEKAERRRTNREALADLHQRLDAAVTDQDVLAIVDDPAVRRLRDHFRDSDPGTPGEEASIELEGKIARLWERLVSPNMPPVLGEERGA